MRWFSVAGRRSGASGKCVSSLSMEPPREGSAAQIHLTEIADGLVKSGFDVRRVWRSPERSAIASMWSYHVAAARSIPRADVVYFRWHPLDYIPTAMCRLLGTPYVLEMNGILDDLLSSHPKLKPISNLLEAFVGWQVRGASGIICVSAPLAQLVERLYSVKSPVIALPNGGPVAIIENRREAVEPSYVIYAGTLLPRQGIQLMVNARHDPAWPDGVDLMVAGHGPLANVVKAHAEDGCLSFRGNLDRNDLIDIIAGASASLSLQDSAWQRNHVMGLPLKVTESLMLGVPVVGSEVSDMRELIGDLPGCEVVDATMPKQVAEAVGRAVLCQKDVRERLSRQAASERSWALVATRTGDFLVEVLNSEQS